MSARTNGQPIWRMRPVINDVIREDMATLVVGSLEAVMETANALHAATGIQHAVSTALLPPREKE